jgi:hypothetical protein
MISELNLLLEDYIEIKDIEGLVGLSIYQVKVSDILKLGEEKYEQLMLPFCLTLDLFNLTEEGKSQLNVFDIFFIKDFNTEQDFQQLLINSLIFFLGKEKVYAYKDENGNLYKSIIIDDKFFVTEDNFELLCDYILQINQKERIKIEKEPVYEGENAEKKLVIWRKMTKGRKETQAKEGLTLTDIIKLVKYGNLRRISKEEIKNMTLYELYDAYRMTTSEKGFDLGMTCSLAGAEIKKEEDHPVTSWVQIFKTNLKISKDK